MIRMFCFVAICFFSTHTYGQLFFKGALKANREKMYRNLVQQTINKNLSYDLTDSTEENWQDAFNAIEVLRYRSMWIDGRIQIAAEQMHNRSAGFQRAALELFYASYPDTFYQPVKLLLMQTDQPKIFAMCASYILQSRRATEDASFLAVKTQQLLGMYPDNPILQQLTFLIAQQKKPVDVPSLLPLLQKKLFERSYACFQLPAQKQGLPGHCNGKRPLRKFYNG